MTVDAYIGACQQQHAVILTEIRTIVHQCLPTVEECISYGMPTFRFQNAVLFHIGKARHCCSIYPGSRVIAELGTMLDGYSVRKATIHLPLDRQVSQLLIENIISLRIRHL